MRNRYTGGNIYLVYLQLYYIIFVNSLALVHSSSQARSASVQIVLFSAITLLTGEQLYSKLAAHSRHHVKNFGFRTNSFDRIK